jgi:hypothetical protein
MLVRYESTYTGIRTWHWPKADAATYCCPYDHQAKLVLSSLNTLQSA